MKIPGQWSERLSHSELGVSQCCQPKNPQISDHPSSSAHPKNHMDVGDFYWGVLSHGSSSKFILVLKPMVTKWALNNQSCSLQPLARIILQLGVFQKHEKISAGSFMSKLIWRFAELRLPVEAGSVFFSIKPDLQNATAWSSRNTEI